MDRAELIRWAREYDRSDSPASRKTEERLSKKFSERGYATKADLAELLKWKFQSMPGRLKRQLNVLKANSDTEIVRATKRAFECKSDLEKIKALKSIMCVGDAVCSVILSFHDPENYGAFDIHSGRELLGRVDPNRQSSAQLASFFSMLRKISARTGLPCRQVEKAIFWKNYREGNKPKLLP